MDTKKYLFLTFIIAYIFWGFDIILSVSGKYIHPAYNFGLLFYLIAVNSPIISIIILFKNKKHLLDFIKNQIGQTKNILFSLFLGILFLFCQLLLPFICNKINVFGNILQVIIYLPVMIFFGGTEEFGWRGYLQSTLIRKTGFIKTVLLTYIIWLLWHMPLCFISGTYQNIYPYWVYSISLLGTTISLAVIRYISNSIIGCILFHGLGNAIVSYGVTIEGINGLIYSVSIQILAAIIILFVYNYLIKNNIRGNGTYMPHKLRH